MASLAACRLRSSERTIRIRQDPDCVGPSRSDSAQTQALLASLPAPFNTADLANGEAKLQVSAAACHTTAQGGPAMTGPNLWGVFGRKAGSAPNFNYSDGLKASGVAWDAPTIAKWITNPRAMVPDTRMSFPGLPEAKDRTDVVAYLKHRSPSAAPAA